MPVRDYDVVVAGAGPAGATAALLLRQRGHRVALIDRAKFPRPAVCAGWLNARIAPLLAEMKVTIPGLGQSTIQRVTFYNADFTKHIQPSFAAPPGFLVDRTTFDSALVAAAKSIGVSLVDGAAVKQIQLKESSVVVGLETGREMEGRFLALTPGRASRLVERVGVGRDPKTLSIWSAQVDSPLPAGSVTEPCVIVVLGLDRRGSFGLCCVSPGRMTVGVNIFGDQAAATAALTRVCQLAHQHKCVPLDLSAAAGQAPVFYSPASAALDMETHVAKHGLVFGDAGGFVAAVSNEGVYPAMWSAQIAAQVFERALQADVRGTPSQDELMRFDSEWRLHMADYLRSPHTDTQFLLPLIFSNQAMADRMAAAFFSGENI